jgi:hypothetical protein
MEATKAVMPAPLSHVWRDVVNDFLEMACFLTDAERLYLMQAMQSDGVKSDTIYVHPSFSIDGRLVIVCEDEKISDCLIYYPRKKKLEKIKTGKK